MVIHLGSGNSSILTVVQLCLRMPWLFLKQWSAGRHSDGNQKGARRKWVGVNDEGSARMVRCNRCGWGASCGKYHKLSPHTKNHPLTHRTAVHRHRMSSLLMSSCPTISIFLSYTTHHETPHIVPHHIMTMSCRTMSYSFMYYTITSHHIVSRHQTKKGYFHIACMSSRRDHITNQDLCACS